MIRLRLAVATRTLSLPLKVSLHKAAELGAGGVLFDARNELTPGELSETGRRQLMHMITELGLSVAGLDFPTRHPLEDPERLEHRLAALREVMQFASQLKSRIVTVRTGRVPAEPDSEESKLLLTILNDLARHGNHVGVTLALAPSPDQPEQIARVVGSVNEGPIGINFDPAAFVMAGKKPADAFRSLHSLVSHVVVRDAVRDAYSGLEVAVGRGEVPWDELLALLDESGFPGWMTVDRTQGDDRAGDVGRAVQYLKQVALG